MMISAISSIQFNNIYANNNVSFTGCNWNKAFNKCYDSFEYSGELKFFKKIFNYAPQNSEKLRVYKGPINKEAGFSTEALNDVGGGWLIADLDTPLSTTGVRTCAVVEFINEELGKHAILHAHHETTANRLEEFIRTNMPNYDRINIVGGDQYKTANTIKKIIQASDNVNPYAEKTFYHTVTENPEIVAYRGDMYYMKGKTGEVSFEQKDQYWY